MQAILMLVIALAGSDWNCTQSDGLWDCRPATAVPAAPARPLAPAATAPSLPPAATSAAGLVAVEPAAVQAPSQPVLRAESRPSASIAADSYVVQIGAFRRRAEARQAVSEAGSEELIIVPTQSDGKTWYVVLLGSFPDLAAARAAGADYEASTGGSYWVRSSAELQAVPDDSSGR